MRLVLEQWKLVALHQRELLAILDGLRGTELGRHLIGADVVEVSPPYDTNSGITALAATAVIDSLLKIMVQNIPL